MGERALDESQVFRAAVGCAQHLGVKRFRFVGVTLPRDCAPEAHFGANFYPLNLERIAVACNSGFPLLASSRLLPAKPTHALRCSRSFKTLVVRAPDAVLGSVDPQTHRFSPSSTSSPDEMPRMEATSADLSRASARVHASFSGLSDEYSSFIDLKSPGDDGGV